MFKRHYVKNPKHFKKFSLDFSNLQKIWRIFEKKINFIA